MSKYYEKDDLTFEPFVREKENELFERASAGDLEARDEIIKNYLKFAASEGLRESKGQFPEDEVLSAANWGLMTAVQRYNPKKGNGFACFARRFIRGRVGHLRRDRLREREREISIGVGNAETHCEPAESNVSGHRNRRRGLGSGLIKIEICDHPVEEQDWQTFWIANVKKFIIELPANEQIAIQVVIFEESDFAVLAKRLKTSPVNARRIYLRAIETLKRLVKKMKS